MKKYLLFLALTALLIISIIPFSKASGLPTFGAIQQRSCISDKGNPPNCCCWNTNVCSNNENQWDPETKGLNGLSGYWTGPVPSKGNGDTGGFGLQNLKCVNPEDVSDTTHYVNGWYGHNTWGLFGACLRNMENIHFAYRCPADKKCASKDTTPAAIYRGSSTQTAYDILNTNFCWKGACDDTWTGTDANNYCKYLDGNNGCTNTDAYNGTQGNGNKCTGKYRCWGGACTEATCNPSTPDRIQVPCGECGQRGKICNESGSGNTNTIGFVFDGSNCARNESKLFCSALNPGICGDNGQCNSSMSVHWKNMLGDEITNASNKSLVFLVAEDLDAAADGQKINFTINSSCKQINKIAEVKNGKAVANWTAYNCNKSNWVLNATFSNSVALYFSRISDELNVSKFENNSAPVANILYPYDGLKINAGVEIQFNQSSYDKDDLMKWMWDFDDKSNATGKDYPLNSENYNTSHIYSKGGPKIVTLTVNSIGRTGTAVANVGIMIVNLSEDYPPLAVISSPKTNTEIPLGIVLFDASKSIDDRTPNNDLNFTWDFGDESPRITKVGDGLIEHDYTGQRAASHTVRLMVTDGAGNSSTYSIIIRLTGNVEKCTGTKVPLGECGKSYGLTPAETWCSLNKNMVNNCTQCPCSNNMFCDRTSGNCTKPDCYNKEYGFCDDKSKGIGCYWNGTLCQNCLDIKTDPGNVFCSFYKQSRECKEDKCNMGLDSQGSCSWNGKCDLQKVSKVLTSECNGVMCSQRVNCNSKKEYDVTCDAQPFDNNKAIKCCDSCGLTKTSLDGIACGGTTASINAVMPLFGWMQFTAAALVIGLFYLLKNKVKQKVNKIRRCNDVTLLNT